MTVRKKTIYLLWILVGAVGALGVCLVITLVSIFLLRSQSGRSDMQTEIPFPQPAAAITAQTIDQVRELQRIPQPGLVYDVAWSPDGRILASAVISAGSAPGSVKLWEASSGRNLRSFEQVRIDRLAFSPDSQMLAASGDTLLVWNMADGGEMVNSPVSRVGGCNLAFSPDGRILAYQSNQVVNLLELPGGSPLRSFQHDSTVRGMAFLPDGRSLITASVQKPGYDKTILTIWDIESGNTLRTFPLPDGIDRLMIAPDGSSFATGANSMIKIWDLAGEENIQSFSGFRFGVPRFAFSPDGSVLAAGEGIGFEVASPSRLRLFDVADGREVPMLSGHTGVITNVAFSPDGRLLATASEDKTIRLWGIPTE